MDDVFSTPLICMQRWLASMTTPTPYGRMTVSIASATSRVKRSCTCKRLNSAHRTIYV